MRIAYLSPLPPATTGIADYSAALLPELARLAQVEVYWDEPTPLSRRFDVRPTRELAERSRRCDAVLYHLGNSRFHGAIYEALRRTPGIVILHDGTLHHFFVERTLYRGDAPAYLREMAYAHGAAGCEAGAMVARGAGLYPFYTFPLLRRAVDLAHGVIVHSHTIRRAVLEARPHARVEVIDHFAFEAPAPARTRSRMLRQLRLPADSFIVASFGQVGYGKRAEVALEGFALFAAHEPRARFVWVGDLFREYDLRPLLRRLGIAERVIFTGRVSDAALADYLALADVGVNLRFPTTGEASGAVMRLLAYGKPTLVSRVGWFEELPDEAVIKVEVGAQEAERVAAHLTRLRNDRAGYARLSAAGRALAQARTPARAASEYVEFAREIVEGEYVRAA